MSASFSFAQARPLANHCAELFVRDVPAGASRNCLLEFGTRTATRLAPQLGRFFGTGRVRVTCTAAGAMPRHDFLTGDGAQAVNAILEFPSGPGTLVSTIAGGDLMAVTEQLFGGNADGISCQDELPLTAGLVAAQLHAMLATALEEVACPAGQVQITSRIHDGGEAVPLDERDSCDVVLFTVEQPDQAGWTIRLTACPSAQRVLLRETASTAKPPAAAGHAVCGMAAGVPFELRAVMAELPLPLARVSRLRTGDLVPFVMPRAVALKIGDVLFADAAAGAVDGQMSLQLTRVF